MNKPKLFVVEGTHDEVFLKSIIPGILTISVGGSQIKKDVIDFLINHQDKFDIILLLDPDHAGEYIRKKLSKILDHPKHIFVEQKDAHSTNRKKIGIEHMDSSLILNLLANEIVQKNQMEKLMLSDLYALGLTGSKDSKLRRSIITNHFHLGHCNSKTLLDRLSWIGLTKEDIKAVLDATSS